MIKSFLFDLDGTIWSSENTIIKSISQTIFDKKDIFVEEYQIKTLLRANFTFKEVLQKYKIYSLSPYWTNYRKFMGSISLFFPETLQIFAKLQNKSSKIGFVTSLKKEFSMNLLKKFGLYDYANVIITPTECRTPKPNARSLLMAIRELHINSSEVIYIGDTENDVIAAKNARCFSGLAMWGNQQPINIKPDYVLNKLSDILGLS